MHTAMYVQFSICWFLNVIWLVAIVLADSHQRNTVVEQDNFLFAVMGHNNERANYLTQFASNN